MDLQDKLRQGILAAKTGEKKKAYQLLLDVVKADENQILAWLWLSSVVDDLDEKELCLENALALEPDNEAAQKGILWVRNQRLKASLAQQPSIEPPKPLAPPPKIIIPEKPLQDEFENEWLCPYCTTLTSPEDKICPHCHRQLLIRQRLSPERSVWLWRGIFLQIYTAFYTAAFGVGYFSFICAFYALPAFYHFWPLYFGQTVNYPASVTDQVLEFFPVWMFWTIVAIALYSLSLTLVLFLRIPYGHLMYLLNSGMMLLIGIFGMIFSPSRWIMFGGFLGVLLGLLQLLITNNLWKDFTFEESRLRLHLDQDATNAPSLYLSARKYARLGMWGNAIIHLRRAVAKSAGNLDYHLALVVAYLNTQRIDQAQQALEEASTLDPDAPQIKKLEVKLQQAVESKQ